MPRGLAVPQLIAMKLVADALRADIRVPGVPDADVVSRAD